MKADQLFVSVIVPVYNGEAFLAEAIESVLRQNYRPLEIIIVDDGSTDRTAKIAEGFGDGVRYCYQLNGGPPVARNRGLRLARGDVISFLDADDMWSDDKLQVQLAYLASEPSADIVIGHTQLIRLSGVKNRESHIEKHPHSWPALSLGGSVIRKSAFAKVGSFDETLAFNDDVDWFMRAKELGMSLVFHKEVTQFYRRHDRNITNQRGLNQKYFVMALKRSLDRRRSSLKSGQEGE